VKKLKSSKIVFAAITVVLALLMVSSTFTVFSSSSVPAVVAQAGPVTDRVDPITGEPYGDLYQYEWIGDGSTWSGGDGPESQKYSAGPAPGRPDVLWTLSEREDIGTWSSWGKSEPAFVGGYVILRSRIAGEWYISALDPLTGDLKWQIPHPSSGAPEIIDDTHFKVDEGSGASAKWIVHNIADGTFAFNVTGGPPTSGYIYIEEKVLYRTETVGSGNEAQWRLVGYDISNPQQGVPVIWNISSNWGANPSHLCAGDGLTFYSSWGDYYIVAINVTDGKTAWNVMGKTNLRDSIYYDGKLITSGVGTRLRAYKGATGELLWDYNAGVRGYFANTGCAAYGMIYQHCMDIPWGYFGAWDADTGELVWKTPAWYNIGYFSPSVADGKIYTLMSDGRGVSQSQDLPDQFAACLDAFTGEIIWTVPHAMGMSGFSGYIKIAYGCVWYRDTNPTTLVCVSDVTTAPPFSMWRGNTEQSGVAVGQSGPSDISNYIWKYETEGPITGSPVIADAKVYFGSQDENIYCLNARNGSLIWKFPTEYKVRSTPAVVGGRVYTGADDGNVYCIDADTGTQIWKRDIDGTYNGELEFPFSGQWMMRSSPIIVGNRLYVGALDGKVYCLNTANGDIEWTHQTNASIGGSAAYYDGVIYIGSVDGALYALDAANGNLVWQTMVARGFSSYTGLGITGTPLVVPSEGKIFIQSSSGYSPRVLAYHISNGTACTFWNSTEPLELVLSGSTPASSTPVWYEGLLYTVGYWRVQCWNASSGERLWQVYMGHQTFSSPFIADGIDGPKLYVGDEVGAVHCIDISNASEGKPLSVYATPGTVPGSPALWERKIYLGWVDWNLYCFGDATVEEPSIMASLSKTTIDEGDSVTVTGKLLVPRTNEYTGEQFYPGLPSMEVLVSFGKDGDRHDESATTDKKGEFTVTYTPTEAGTYSVMAWYEGKDMVTYSYNYAYSDEMSLKVKSEEEPPNGNGEEPEEGIPMEYVYAIVAAIAIVIIAAVGYLYMKRRK
jgi:outer membrane protein assembly factor BamB